MKITLFTENYKRGGVDTFIVMLLNNWPDDADDFTLICNEDHPGLHDIRDKLRRPCRIVTHRIKTYSGLSVRTQSKKLLNLLRKVMLPVAKYLYLANAVRALRIFLCDGRTDRLMIINGGYPAGDSCRAAGIAWGLYSQKPPSIHNFHNLTVYPRLSAMLQEYVVDALLARHTKAFITVSQAAVQSMTSRLLIPMHKVSHIYNGLETSETPGIDGDIRRELGIDSDAPLCLMMGTYEPRKGHSFLLKVFQRVVELVPQAKMLVCGHGSDQEISFVRNLVSDFGLENNVLLRGFRKDAMQILGQASILLVGSQAFESFGLTCVEAMARRIPVVATDVGGLPEVVENGDGGFCVKRNDVEAFAGHVIRLLSDDNLRREQGQKGYERYLRFFTARRMAEEYAKLIKD